MAVIEALQAPTTRADEALPAALPRVLHATHYTAALQRALQEVEQVDAGALVRRAAAEVIHRHLMELPGWTTTRAEVRLRQAAELFRVSGLGILELTGVGESGGAAEVRGSHFARAWVQRFGEAQSPTCAAVAGFVEGAMAAVFGRDYEAREAACLAQGHPSCSFHLAASPGPREAHDEERFALYPSDPAPAPSAETGAAAVASLLGTPPEADDDGRIGALGEEFSHLWADYYNRICFRFEREIPRLMGSKFTNLPGIVLTEAGHLYAYRCFGAILGSHAWQSRVRPLLTSREQWVHALVALVNALGWGTWRVQVLVPGERLSMRVYDGYEGNGYRQLYGHSPQPRCYLARGAAAAIMNLVYVGDVSTAPALTDSHYNELFRSPLSFRALETRCRAMDDPYCELVVNPLSPTLSAMRR